MSYCDHSPSVVRPFTPLNFSSETPVPNFFKRHAGPCVIGGLNIYKNGHGP